MAETPNRRRILKGLLGLGLLAAFSPRDLLPADAAPLPGATPATALPPIIERPVPVMASAPILDQASPVRLYGTPVSYADFMETVVDDETPWSTELAKQMKDVIDSIVEPEEPQA
jgi:hypothetical protein